jgi:hypothetical protein
VRVMCKPGSEGGRGGQPPRSTRPDALPDALPMPYRNVPIVPNGTERQTTLRKKFVTVGINAE